MLLEDETKTGFRRRRWGASQANGKAHDVPKTWIAHLDADCFYVSAERVRDEFLQEKPVGVLGNQGACVIAKSYEMKAAGVTTGEPIWEAVKKCPDGVFIKRDFHWYEVLSREMLKVVQEHAPRVEYYSVDEFFLAFEANNPQSFAKDLQKRVLDQVGVPVTIGVARTKTLAKLVSDTAKPFGALALLDPSHEREILANRSASDVTGVGGRRAARLAAHGIHTCLDFAQARPSLIRSLLTVVGEKLCYELQGDPCFPLQCQRPPHKVLSRGGSVGEPTADPAMQWAWGIRNLERLLEALEYHGMQTGKLALSLEFKDAPPRGAETTFESPTDRFDRLHQAAEYLWSKTWLPGLRLYRMHYWASRLTYRSRRQLGLFDAEGSTNHDPLRRVQQAVNARMGRFALRSAATLPLKEIYVDQAHSYDICDIHGKTCF